MLEISIMQVQDPGCFWARIVKGAEMCIDDPKKYEDLYIRMNLFYHRVNLDVPKFKPQLLEKGQVCVVYSSILKSWCRAIVESLFQGAAGCWAHCFLVDHAEHITVNSEKILAPLEKFVQVPFRIRKFKLSGVYPMTLQVSDCLEKAELVPSKHWDTSATRYFRNLLQAASLTEAVLCDQQGDSTAVELYFTIENVKVCVNDELVNKRFACFSSEKAPSSLNSPIGKSSPNILACDIYSTPGKFLSNGFTKLSLPSISPRKDNRDAKIDTAHPLVKQEVYLTGQEQHVPSLHAQCPKLESLENRNGHSGKAETKMVVSAGNSIKGLERSRKLLSSSLQKFVSKVGFGENEEDARDISVATTEETDNVLPLTSERSTLLLDCVWLLQFLSPDPLVPDTESSTLPSVQEPSRMGILVHSAMDINPCSSLASAPLTEDVCKALRKWRYTSPGVTECYCWPAVARGCDTLIVSSNGNDPLIYLPPFLTHLMLCSVYSTMCSQNGPLAVILCPGWEKSQLLFEMLEDSSAAHSLNPMIVLVGHKKEEAKTVRIKNNCQLLVTTPFSLVRLLGFHSFLFLRLCHLVLDEVDVLYTRAPEEMSTILQHFNMVAATDDQTSLPRQIIAAGKSWSRHSETLITKHMRDPSVIITSPEEAALYGNVHQIVLLCLDCTKISMLLHCLNFSSEVAQKVLIITNSVDEVELVFAAVSSRALFCLKVHEKVTYHFDFVIEQWRKDIGPDTHIVLITTDECMKALEIQDANCVLHYGFPSSPKWFGRRLFCMSKNFRNLSDKDCEQKPLHMAKSVLLLSECNASHVNGVLRYMKRTNAILPNELLDFANSVLQSKEKQKTNRPLCCYLKSFGFCRDYRVCPDRHTIDPIQDAPQHPDSGILTIMPLYIKNASCYYGYIVSGKEDSYRNLAVQMAEHYANQKLRATEVVEGGIYGVQEEDVYHRVQVQSMMGSGENTFYSVRVCFLDDGHQQELKAHQLLKLPNQFQILPPQAVEIIVCRIQPIDGEVDWNPKVSRYISKKIKGVEHQGKIVLCLGNTIWVDPMVRITRVPRLKTTINDYNVHSEILATGMGINNPQHVDLLKEMCQRADVEKTPYVIGPRSVLANMKTVETEIKDPPRSMKDGLALQSCVQSVPIHLREENAQVLGLSQLKDRMSGGHGVDHENVTKRFHPQIKWFQREDCIVLNIKLIDPLGQTCKFFPSRVVYSGTVDDRHYQADLALHSSIIPDKCSWGMKYSTPVIKLMKTEKGFWKTLLKQKSLFASLDFDHIEEDDENHGSGLCFLGNPGEEGDYVSGNETATDTDSES